MKLKSICEAPKDVESLRKRFVGWKVYLKRTGKFAKLSINNSKGESLGDAVLMNTSKNFWSITDIQAVGGTYRSNKWGPLLYDIIIEFATMSGDGLIPAETLTLIEKELVRYTSAIAPSGKPINTDLGNFTSPHAKRIYKRFFDTRKGLYGQSIEVNEIVNSSEKIGPSFIPLYLKGTNLENIPYDWRKKPEWIESVKQHGGIISSDGWPTFNSHTERNVKEHQYLYAIYRKEPFIIPKLRNHHLIEII